MKFTKVITATNDRGPLDVVVWFWDLACERNVTASLILEPPHVIDFTQQEKNILSKFMGSSKKPRVTITIEITDA